MRDNPLAHCGLAAQPGDDDGDDQLSLPFDMDEPEPKPRLNTSRHVLDLIGRRGHRYELIVHQDPYSGMVLSYALRTITLH